ncbi:MarR family winged helix-turn-helix transcriptional regulator [Microbacterium terrisoli]|jgi:DNA-binding MarR family transcriptional regulator|uniref:MarR family winged helix-turn-helix transcriptional regulator n=1 Tax=Microbacterium terrisoli TaxID=3242192 RepID=UPI0028052077|nr:MarR family transcriptional regulator [Microbacterium protaetiae]
MGPTVLDRLLEISALFQRDMRSAFAGTSLTETRVHALWVLQLAGPVTQQILAHELGTTARSVSALVQALETHGYILRTPHPDDRRAVLVTLTEEARRVMTRMQHDHEALTASLLSAVDEADRPAFERGVVAVLERLRTLTQTESVAYTEVEDVADRGGAS